MTQAKNILTDFVVEISDSALVDSRGDSVTIPGTDVQDHNNSS